MSVCRTWSSPLEGWRAKPTRRPGPGSSWWVTPWKDVWQGRLPEWHRCGTMRRTAYLSHLHLLTETVWWGREAACQSWTAWWKQMGMEQMGISLILMLVGRSAQCLQTLPIKVSIAPVDLTLRVANVHNCMVIRMFLVWHTSSVFCRFLSGTVALTFNALLQWNLSFC